jgi:hypothetical protein
MFERRLKGNSLEVGELSKRTSSPAQDSSRSEESSTTDSSSKASLFMLSD